MSATNGDQWKTERYFSTYEEADALRKHLKGSDRTCTIQLKVKRCGENGNMFVVKSRLDKNALAELQEIEEKMLTKKNKNKK